MTITNNADISHVDTSLDRKQGQTFQDFPKFRTSHTTTTTLKGDNNQAKDKFSSQFKKQPLIKILVNFKVVFRSKISLSYVLFEHSKNPFILFGEDSPGSYQN